MKILATSSLEPRVTAPTPVTHDPPQVPFCATTGIAPPVPILNMAVINTPGYGFWRPGLTENGCEKRHLFGVK